MFLALRLYLINLKLVEFSGYLGVKILRFGFNSCLLTQPH